MFSIYYYSTGTFYREICHKGISVAKHLILFRLWAFFVLFCFLLFCFCLFVCFLRKMVGNGKSSQILYFWVLFSKRNFKKYIQLTDPTFQKFCWRATQQFFFFFFFFLALHLFLSTRKTWVPKLDPFQEKKCHEVCHV